ncbi:cation-translocating P-type ATPase [Chitinophagaceae bacterium LB-8]|uniref:Cation-translocating P-type ATPase n=1 Tax=Paraflavisolibacter caeni TaxID=2982496 RepID=A0A9X2XSU8_9BACT|nr:cation-translocating P-type ATPase [Paraflavisolibacter caeni]MCU7547636.1 cation-translocating P-type ATPase [Paraflavisolibacter caeni]
MEKVQWKVEGMDCANCALTVHKYLQKNGADHIAVNAIDGDVSFELAKDKTSLETLAKGIESLGYKVGSVHQETKKKKPFLSTNLSRFLFCLPFTAVLLFLHMVPGLHFHALMNPWVQLAITLPVFFVGMRHFGRSAIKSIRNRVPNMNVLITVGASSAFIYSLIGAIFNLGTDYLFFETAATIITLVFLGEYLEDASIQSTQRSLKALVKSQKVMANMIAFDDKHQEHIFPVENTQLKSGDLILIRTGEQVPADCKVLWGEAQVNESIITGESVPVYKTKKDKLIGGSILEDGTIKAYVTAAGDDTILSNILKLVKKAQGEKPPVQQLADKISGVFVPVVLSIAAITLVANWLILGAFTPALMRSIAVLVIACPCAMGLATPAAIAVGLGRGARNGILFRNAKSLELFRNVTQVVFDKTGTLTTGAFVIGDWKAIGIDEEAFKRIVFSLEKYSNHPLAKSIAKHWRTSEETRWQQIEEVKGKGMQATDKEGNHYKAGSYTVAKHLTTDHTHNIYIVRNNELIGWIDLEDELRPEAKDVVRYLKSKNLKTILLSGDRLKKSQHIAEVLGLDEVIAEQTPEQKLQTITDLSAKTPTVMIGDGINDAPALAKATIGISMSEASQLAMQSAHVVLMNSGLKKLPTALGLGRHTYMTIKQNLFWAFLYNIIAIPVAAFGFLSPTFGALVMGLSDVVLAANSVRLFVKKVD